jgi:hypothetical protein
MATFSEMSFAHQIQRHTKMELVQPILYAQLFCWLGLLTGDLHFHVVEESIWAFSAVRVMYYCLKRYLYAPALLAAVYAGYMIFVDIPMYATRESVLVTVTQGVKELVTCKVDHDWRVWQEDAIWMTGYFIGGTQISFYLN